MLTYNPPVSMNGQSLSSNNNMSTSRQVISPTKPVRQSTTTNNSAATNGQIHPKHHHIWLVTGPAGCGKTTIAQHVANSLNLPYIEGDEVGFPTITIVTIVQTHGC